MKNLEINHESTKSRKARNFNITFFLVFSFFRVFVMNKSLGISIFWIFFTGCRIRGAGGASTAALIFLFKLF